MSKGTYFRIAGVFFLADVIFHIMRVFVWWTSGADMQLPIWVSCGAIFWSGFFAWQGFKLAMKS